MIIVAFAIGFGIREVRIAGAPAQPKVVAKSDKPAEEPAKEKVIVAAEPGNTVETSAESQGTASAEEEPTLSSNTTQGTTAQFTIISKEERPEPMREGRPQITHFSELSEEDQAKLKEDMQEFMDRAGKMTLEERKKATAEIKERYGLPSR